MTEGICICFFASRGKCSESKLWDAKPQRITEASLKGGNDEHNKISEIIEHYEKHGHEGDVDLWAVNQFLICISGLRGEYIEIEQPWSCTYCTYSAPSI